MHSPAATPYRSIAPIVKRRQEKLHCEQKATGVSKSNQKYLKLLSDDWDSLLLLGIAGSLQLQPQTVVTPTEKKTVADVGVKQTYFDRSGEVARYVNAALQEILVGTVDKSIEACCWPQ